MSHQRLGETPKSRKWSAVVDAVAGSGVGGQSNLASSTSEIADLVLVAAASGLQRAIRDSGLRYTFYLLTQIVLAAREENWGDALSGVGIHVGNNSSLFDFVSGIQDVIDRESPLVSANIGSDVVIARRLLTPAPRAIAFVVSYSTAGLEFENASRIHSILNPKRQGDSGPIGKAASRACNQQRQRRPFASRCSADFDRAHLTAAVIIFDSTTSDSKRLLCKRNTVDVFFIPGEQRAARRNSRVLFRVTWRVS